MKKISRMYGRMESWLVGALAAPLLSRERLGFWVACLLILSILFGSMALNIYLGIVVSIMWILFMLPLLGRIIFKD